MVTQWRRMCFCTGPSTRFGKTITIELGSTQKYWHPRLKCLGTIAVFSESQISKGRQRGLWFWTMCLIAILSRPPLGSITLLSRRRILSLLPSCGAKWEKWSQRQSRTILTWCMTTKCRGKRKNKNLMNWKQTKLNVGKRMRKYQAGMGIFRQGY